MITKPLSIILGFIAGPIGRAMAVAPADELQLIGAERELYMFTAMNKNLLRFMSTFFIITAVIIGNVIPNIWWGLIITHAIAIFNWSRISSSKIAWTGPGCMKTMNPAVLMALEKANPSARPHNY